MAKEITQNRKAIIVTPELCIGCRACQVACKSWNQLPGIKTTNSGTYQNPPDLASARNAATTGWQGNRCVYFDAVEALDFYVPLKEV